MKLSESIIVEVLGDGQRNLIQIAKTQNLLKEAYVKILSERNKTLLENGKDAMSEVVKILKEVLGKRDNYYVAKSIIG